MSFICPDCTHAKLNVIKSIMLPADSRSDEIALQMITCSHCGFTGLAIYEESRRGVLRRDHFSHIGYDLPTAEMDIVRDLIARCPNRRSPRCQCTTHKMLGHQDKAGRWDGLRVIRCGSSFTIQREGG